MAMYFTFFIQVDYTSVFAFRLLLFIDNALATGMGLYGLLSLSKIFSTSELFLKMSFR